MNSFLPSQNIRLFSLFILTFSGLGMRIFQFNGSLLIYLVLIFILNFKYLKKIPKRWVITLIFFSLTYSLIFILKGVVIPWYVIVSMLIALAHLSIYKGQNLGLFIQDFSLFLKYSMYFNIIGVALILFSEFFSTIFLDYAEYKRFLGLFWYSTKGGPELFNGLRFTGYVWEPGIWQFFMNANLIFAFHEKRKLKQIILAIISVIIVFSTTGLILLFVVVFLSLFFQNKLKRSQIFFLLTLFVSVSPFLINTIKEKFTGEFSPSAITRVADIFTGYEIIKNNLILGGDIDKEYENDLWGIRKQLWTGNFYDGAFEGYSMVKNSNGFVRFITDWGLPISLFLLIKTTKSNLFLDRKLMFLFMISLYISMFSEAISRTAFFYMLVMSSFLFKKYKI
jgi:hypothetical protein